MLTEEIRIAISNFSLFTFLALFLSSIRSKDRLKDNYGILISSFLMFISNSVLYFEVKSILNNNPSAILSFITYSTVVWAVVLLIFLIRKLYIESSILNFKLFIFHGFMAGVAFSIMTILESTYLIRTLVFGLFLGLPILRLLYSLIKNNVSIVKNVFIYQFIIISIFFVLKILNIIIYEPQAYYDTVSQRDTIFTMLPIIILITIFTSYLIEKQHDLNFNLNLKTSILEGTLIKVKTMSETDQLTGLSNRHKIMDDLDILKGRYKVFSEDFSIIMCDVNNFKYINDTYGHNAGDNVLKFLSTALKQLLRDSDIVGRWGGDEIILLLPNTGDAHIASIKDKINLFLANNGCPYIKEQLSLSMGSSTYYQGVTLEKFINEADIKMYEDKKQYLRQ